MGYGLGCMWLGNSVAEKDLGVLGDNRLNINQQSTAAATANCVLGCILRGTMDRKRCDYPNSTRCLSGHTCSTVSSLGPPPFEKDMDRLEGH